MSLERPPSLEEALSSSGGPEYCNRSRGRNWRSLVMYLTWLHFSNSGIKWPSTLGSRKLTITKSVGYFCAALRRGMCSHSGCCEPVAMEGGGGAPWMIDDNRCKCSSYGAYDLKVTIK